MDDTAPQDGLTDPLELGRQKRWLDLARLGRKAWNTWADEELKKPLRERAEVDLSGQEIDVSDFRGFKFSNNVNFHKSVFVNGVFFRNVTFCSEVNFGNAIFKNKADFQLSKFQGAAHFGDTTFTDILLFNKAEFSKNVSFKGADFLKDSHFIEMVFSNQVSFESAVFLSNVEFRNTVFKNNVDFNGAVFKSNANFHRALLSADANFFKVTFSADAVFNSVNVVSIWNLTGANVTGGLIASDADIKGHAYFSAAEFQVPPDFTSTAFAHSPAFLNAVFRYPTPNRLSGKCTVPDGAARFRRLKQLAADAHDHEMELALFAFETRAKRFYSQGLSQLVLSYIYEWFSNFGQSWVRPLCWLLVTVLSAFLKFWSVAPAGTSLWVAAVAAGVNVFPFAGQAVIGREIMTRGLCPVPEGAAEPALDCLIHLYTISAVEGVFALIFLFLIGLGLRNRFRIK